MTRPSHRRRTQFFQAVAMALLLAALSAGAQAPPASTVSAKDTRAAAAAFLAGAKQLSSNNAAAAERSFTRAVALDPSKNEYAQALTVARQHHVTALVQQAAKARLLGRRDEAAKLFAEAKALDPDSEMVAQHLDIGPLPPMEAAPRPAGSEELARLGGPIKLLPTPGTHSFHRRADVQDLLREVYTAYGIRPTFDSTVTGQGMRLDLDDADYATATRVLLMMSHIFATPLTSDSVLLAKDTRENRDRLVAQIEETVYLPGLPPEQLTELSNIAKNIFDLKQVNVAQGGGAIIMRGPDDALQLVNATFAEIVDGGADVMIEVRLYEFDKTFTRNVGAAVPSSLGFFSLAAEAQSLVTANQSLIQQAIAAGQIKLTGNYYTDLLTEAIALIGSGVVTSSEFTNLLGFIGTFGKYTTAAGTVAGVPLLGVFLNSTTSVNALLNSSDVRAVDNVQLRTGDRQLGTFRSGVRYPITTATYSSGVSSSLASSLSGIKINGTPVSSLLSSLTASTTPMIQYEDLGLTLKATPQVLKSGQVFVHVDMKIEALGGGTINSIPILNSRQLTSDITIPDGQTAMLTSEVSSQESRAIQGIPLLNEIPGFGGTERSVERDTTELLITLTPHVIRKRSPVVATRRISANLGPEAQ